jgi:hypothetical protein
MGRTNRYAVRRLVRGLARCTEDMANQDLTLLEPLSERGLTDGRLNDVARLCHAVGALAQAIERLADECGELERNANKRAGG